MIKLEPDLSHCIQTLAKAEYNRIQSELLETGETNTDLSHRLETLKGFLESTDFNELRSQYEPYLVEGKRVSFTIQLIAEKTEYRMEIQ